MFSEVRSEQENQLFPPPTFHFWENDIKSSLYKKHFHEI